MRYAVTVGDMGTEVVEADSHIDAVVKCVPKWGMDQGTYGMTTTQVIGSARIVRLDEPDEFGLGIDIVVVQLPS